MLWTWSACHAVTLSEIIDETSVGSYSNFLGGLFTSDGNSRGFEHTGNPRFPAFQHDLARDFIASNYQAMGYTTWLDPFSFTYKGTTYTNCNNVVAIKEGSGGTNVFIVGAHYDSVDPSTSSATMCPGADDNGSGSAGLLEAARVIQDYTFRDTIIFIAFDAEEKGYRGAAHFLNTHVTSDVAQTNSTVFLLETIKGMMSVDMIAYDDTNTPKLIFIGSMDTNINSRIDLALAQSATNYTSLIPIRNAGWTGSDHNPFHQAGIDSAVLIEGDLYVFETVTNAALPLAFNNPYYHSNADSIDSPGYISYSYATEATKCIVGYLCDQAKVIPPATLMPSTPDSATFQINWYGSPGVSYSLFGTSALSTSNTWTHMAHFAATNAVSEYSYLLDLNHATQTMFRVHSE